MKFSRKKNPTWEARSKLSAPSRKNSDSSALDFIPLSSFLDSLRAVGSLLSPSLGFKAQTLSSGCQLRGQCDEAATGYRSRCSAYPPWINCMFSITFLYWRIWKLPLPASAVFTLPLTYISKVIFLEASYNHKKLNIVRKHMLPILSME